MKFPVKPSGSLMRGLISSANKVSNSVKKARVNRGQLAPVASAKRAANQAHQKVLRGIAEKAREGDRLGQIELKLRRGYFR